MSDVLALLWKILLVAGGVGLVIFVHELGHFMAAKACGVKCEKFFIGFDIPMRIGPVRLPSAFCRFQWGETQYGVGILPLGGYVKMLGQDDNPSAQAREAERIKVSRQKADPSVPGADTASVAAGQRQADESNESPGDTDGDRDNQDEQFELDPRSYPAKPVWQRMIIISAGVIMNLISAVFFAAIAYNVGVSYTPCVIGGTAPGNPAWIQGLKPEDKILQIGRNGQPDEHLRFVKDLMPNVMLNGGETAMDVLIRRHGKDEAEWIIIKPTEPTNGDDDYAKLGVTSATTTKLSLDRPVDDYRFDGEAYEVIQGGDKIVAVNGIELPHFEQSDEILSHHVETILAQRVNEDVLLTVLRQPVETEGDQIPASPELLEITLPPSKMRVLGLSMKVGPIVGVREGTPAEKAGFKTGDVIVSVGGEDVGNPLTLAQRLLPMVGQEVEIGVSRRGIDEPLVLCVMPQLPTAHVDSPGPGSFVSLGSLGVAFRVENVVQDVAPDSPADKAGLRAGDKITSVQFVVDDEDKLALAESLFGRDFGEPIELDEDQPNWHYVHSITQVSVPGTTLKLSYLRDGAKKTVKVAPEYSDRWFCPDRGLIWTKLSRVRTAESLSEAWSLGVRETKESLTQVLAVLKKLLTGKISPKKLGGPIMIVAAAGSEASEGVPRLLVFLTFLSANLAVLNFLPIPALDGGHMVFLAAEGIRGKPVDERLQLALTWIGVLCLLSLMALVFALDIDRFFL
jgi:regulator of sigma E protease